MPPREITSVPSGSAAIHSVHAGTGPAVVLLHAGVADHRMWLDQLDALAASRLALAYDRRGFGATSSPDEEFSHVEDLHRLLDAFDVERAALVGCSQGGRIAIDFAVAYPERVTELCLIAPALSGYESDFVETPEVEALEARIEAAEEAGDLEAVNRLEALAWLDGPGGPEGRVTGTARDLFLDMNGIALAHPELTRSLEPPSAMPHLASLDQPTLVAWGALDFPWHIDLCERLVHALPAASTHVFLGTAHLPSIEDPDAVTTQLRGFLA